MNESTVIKSSEHLINLIVTRNGSVPNFALLLGSGASVTSGVKTAEDMVLGWRQLLHRQSSTRDSYPDWIRSQDWFENEDEYSLLFEEVYDQPAQRRVFVEECVKHAHAGLGYVYLADLLANRFFDVVFTTNFDDLLNEACYLYSDSLRPIVAAHDSAIQNIRISSERPKIIKLHGDFLYDDIKNTLSELETLEANTKRKLGQFAKEYGLIVLGYSGRDRSVMDNLELLLRDEENFPYGIYWCVRGDPEPSKRLKSLLTRDKVYPVDITGFDEFVAELHALAGLDPPKAIEHPLEMARDRARIFLNTQLPLRSHKIIGPHIDRLIENILVVDIELPLIAKAAIFTSQGDLVRALQLWEQVYEEDPTDANTTYAYASALVEAGKNDRLLNLRHELPAHLDTPLFLLPGLEFVFLSIWRTVSREMLSANSNSTTLSANNWSVQCVCPSGAALHAKAIRCASCRPSSLRSRPGHGRSLMAASSPSSTYRFRALATVAGLTNSTSAISRSRSPWSALSSDSARFTVRTDALPRWDTSLRRERSASVSSTLYLMAAMAGHFLTQRSCPSMAAFLYSYKSTWQPLWILNCPS